MKYGISLLPDCRPEVRSPTDYFRDALAVSRQAEQVGLHYVKMTEHYLGNYGGYSPSPLTFLAAVAAQTESIRLMTGCTLPAFHHPIQLAAHAAMVDVMSEGRLEVGFARAWLPYEFTALGIPIDTSRDRFQTSILAILRLWTESNVSEETPYFAFDQATSLPHPVQDPHPPVWGAAIRSPQSFRWLAERGFGLLVSFPPVRQDLSHSRELIDIYRERFEEVHGPRGAKPRVAISLPMYVSRNSQVAKEHAAQSMAEYLRVTAEAARSWKYVSSTNYAGYDNMSDAFARISIDELRQDCAGVIGSPSECVDALSELKESFNPDVTLFNTDFGGQSLHDMGPSLDLLASDVLPQLSA